MDVLQVPGEIPGLSLAHVVQRRINGKIGRIGLWTGGHQHGGIRQRKPRFRHSQLQRHVHAGVDDGQDLRIGQPHVLRRDAHQAAAGRGHLPGFQKPCQIMTGGVRVGAADGLVEGGQQVIIVVSVPIGAEGAFLGDLFGVRQRQGELSVLRDSRGKQHLHRVHGLAQVAAAGGRNIFQRPVFGNGGQRGALLHEGNRPAYRLQGGGRGNLLKFKDGGAA